MKKGKVITATIGLNGNVEITAYCLATDSWQDHQYFLAEAIKLEHADKRGSNRSLRAALLILFSHFEGVINQIYLEKNYTVTRRDSLAEKAEYIHKRASPKLARLNIKLWKGLRDIIAHPGIEKTISGDALTERSTYERLSADSVRATSALISQWLDAVCLALAVERFTDTKAMIESLSEGLGQSEGPKEI
ncbi:MAG: hypothetical protein WC661_08750 [Opitutaceae bacterium]|jgi:hypothetical protein